MNTQTQIMKLSFREGFETFKYLITVVEMRINQDSVAFKVIYQLNNIHWTTYIMILLPNQTNSPHSESFILGRINKYLFLTFWTNTTLCIRNWTIKNMPLNWSKRELLLSFKLVLSKVKSDWNSRTLIHLCYRNGMLRDSD